MAFGPVIAAGWAAGAHKLAQPMCCGPPSLNYPGAEAWQPMCCGPPSPNFPGAEAWQGALDGANFRCGCPAAAPRCRPAVPVVQVVPQAVEELRDGGGIAAVRSPRGRAERGRGASPPPLTFVSSLARHPVQLVALTPMVCVLGRRKEKERVRVCNRECVEPWPSLGPKAWAQTLGLGRCWRRVIATVVAAIIGAASCELTPMPPLGVPPNSYLKKHEQLMSRSDALLSLSNSRRAIWASIAGGTVVFAGKLCVVMYCGGMGEASDSIVAETAHSFVDVLNQVFLLVGIERSQRPVSDLHPRGVSSHKLSRLSMAGRLAGRSFFSPHVVCP